MLPCWISLLRPVRDTGADSGAPRSAASPATRRHRGWHRRNRNSRRGRWNGSNYWVVQVVALTRREADFLPRLQRGFGVFLVGVVARAVPTARSSVRRSWLTRQQCRRRRCWAVDRCRRCCPWRGRRRHGLLARGGRAIPGTACNVRDLWRRRRDGCGWLFRRRTGGFRSGAVAASACDVGDLVRSGRRRSRCARDVVALTGGEFHRLAGRCSRVSVFLVGVVLRHPRRSVRDDAITKQQSPPRRKSVILAKPTRTLAREMELGGLEPPTSWVRSRRSPN